MKTSSPHSSSSVTSTSAAAQPETQLLCSSSSPPPPPLQSPQLQAKFLQERQDKFHSYDNCSESGAVSSPPVSSVLPSGATTSSSSSSLCLGSRQVRLSLSSPELLSELKESRIRPLRHVPAHTGLTTIFSGRGGQAPGPAPSTPPANQRASH